MNSKIKSTLNAISAALTTPGLLAMDKAIIIDKDPYAAVAAGWLKAVGIKS